MKKLFVGGVGVVCVALAACNGISYPDPPTAPAPAAGVARSIHLVATPASLPPGGGSTIVYIEVLGANGSGVPNAEVSLSSSGGTLDGDHAVTDATGHAKLGWQGTQTGNVTARLGELSASMGITVEVPTTLPPPSSPAPPPPAPPPPPDPSPTPPAPNPLRVFMSGPATRTKGCDGTFRAEVQGLERGETVNSYEWDRDDASVDATIHTADPVANWDYKNAGAYTPSVQARTSRGRAVTGTMNISVLSADVTGPCPPPE